MPMKRSGRSVEEASRVIEIDDVLLPIIAEGLERVGRRDALEGGLALFLADALAAHLPGHVAVDGCDPGFDPVGGEIVELDVEAGERADVRDAAAHLTGADDADFANLERHAVGTGLRPLFDLDHVGSPVLRRSGPGHHGSVVALCPDGQRPTLPSSAASSGSAW
jgi:hypothetical protein